MDSESKSDSLLSLVFGIMILYALLILSVGLWRSIEAGVFKPNAFYFCLAVSVLTITGAFMIRGGIKGVGLVLALVATATALAFYLWCFITNEQDASIRVALAIVASVGHLCSLATLILPHAESR